MPFYEYECSSCKFCVEAMQKISDAPLRKCPSCGRSTLKKLISAPVFRLKGAGWYETDFKSDKESKRNLAEGDAKSEAGSEPVQPAKSETAPASDSSDSRGKSSPAPRKAKSAGTKAAKGSKPAKKAVRRSSR